MTQFKYNKVLIAFIIVGLFAALAIGWQRHNIEQQSNTVELLMDYEDLVELAQVEGLPEQTVLKQFREAGITSLAVYDTTLEKLNKRGKVTAVSGAQILHQYRSGALNDPDWRSLVATGRIQAENTYVVGQDKAIFEEVKSDLARRLSPERVIVLREGAQPIIEVKANFEKLQKADLGLPTDEMKLVSSLGYYVVPRPTNYNKVREEDVKATFARIQSVDKVSCIVFSGSEVLGHPDWLVLTQEEMAKQGMTLGMIEHPLQLQFFKQEGLTKLAAYNEYNAARLYVIPKDEQPKLKLSEAVHRWVLTDQERNIRLNLLRKYDTPAPGMGLMETNITYVQEVKAALEDKGFVIGRAGTFAPYFPNSLLLSLVMTGAAAAGVLFLTLVKPFKARYQYILLAVISLLFIIPVLKGGGNMVRVAAAFGSAILFPVLAMTWQLDRWKSREPFNGGSLTKILVDGVGGLTITVMLSLIGGFYVGSLLGDVRFLLEMEIFRGVKATFVLPILLISLVYLTRYNLFNLPDSSQGNTVWKQVVKILNYPVYIKSLLAAGFVAVAAWVFVGRSGHTAGVPVPAIELKFREFLEQAMYARPREKEFMIGHPAFILAVMALYKRWPRVLHFALVVAATIGQGSLVETFAHIRTPIFMSFVRALDGLLVGAALGVAAVVAVQVLHYMTYILGRRPSEHE